LAAKVGGFLLRRGEVIDADDLSLELGVQATLHPDVQFIEVLLAHPVSQFFGVCGGSTAVFLEHIQHGFQPL
jgi:hypothetical protein